MLLVLHYFFLAKLTVGGGLVSGDSVDPVLSWKKSVEQSPQESGDIRSKPCSLANLHVFSQSLLGFARSVLQGVYSVGVSTSLLGDFSRFSRNKVYHWLLDIVATFNGDVSCTFLFQRKKTLQSSLVGCRDQKGFSQEEHGI